jgi:hypothetical protein
MIQSWLQVLSSSLTFAYRVPTECRLLPSLLLLAGTVEFDPELGVPVIMYTGMSDALCSQCHC